MHKNKNSFQKAGFSLLEVMITLGILVTMIFIVSQLLRSSFDMKMNIKEKDAVTAKLNNVMSRITYDLSHAFLCPLRIEFVQVVDQEQYLELLKNPLVMYCL